MWVTGSRIPVEEGYTLYGLLLPKPKPKKSTFADNSLQE